MRKNKLLLLLALLMTVATGAWAQSAFTAKGITSASQLTSTDDEAYVAACMPSDFLAVDVNVAKAWTGAPTDGSAMLIYAIDGNKIKMATFLNGSNKTTTGATWSIATFKNQLSNSKFFYTAASGYTVSLKDGVKDADKWTATVGTNSTANPLPVGGLNEGDQVTIQYNGRLKVKGVKATSDAAEATPALSITNPVVGQVIGSDGKNYAYGSLPTGVTAVAKICYVSGSHGLALALTDEKSGWSMNWSTAQTTCAAHTAPFTGGTWKLATKDEWSNMINAAGSDLRDGFSSVGGTNLQSDRYWSFTEDEDNSDLAWLYYFDLGYWNRDSKNSDGYVRACLAF